MFLSIVFNSLIQACLANSIGQNGMIKVPAKCDGITYTSMSA